jgi:hypothetical protein
MGIFNYIDTFFFISLGITFVLILLLVFHFKQRISGLEQKNDTMFDIINNIVKELTNIKSSSSSIISNYLYPSNNQSKSANNSTYEYDQPELNINAVIPVSNFIQNSDKLDNNKVDEGRILVSDNECDSDSDSEDDSESDISDDEDDTYSVDDESATKSNKIEEQVFVEEIKVVNIDLNDSIEVLDELLSDSETNIDDDDNDNDIHTPIMNLDTPTIHIEKLDTTQEIHLEEKSLDNNVVKKDNYQNMTMSELKTLVITKGLVSNASKLKKNDLIKLLESHNEN